jgi:hypothetical protein
MVVRKHNVSRNGHSVEYIKQHTEDFPGTSVWVLYVNLDARWWKGQKYCIEVTCTGMGMFTFRVFDQKNEGSKLEIRSAVWRN